jgi:hypothetical protein
MRNRWPMRNPPEKQPYLNTHVVFRHVRTLLMTRAMDDLDSFRYFRDDELESEEEDRSTSPFLVSEFYIAEHYVVSGIGEYTARGLLNGHRPIWALKVGKTLFYFVWQTEELEDKWGRRQISGVITNAYCETEVLQFYPRHKIKQENRLGYTEISPGVCYQCSISLLISLKNSLVQALLEKFQCHHILRLYYKHFIAQVRDILFPDKTTEFRLPDLYNVISSGSSF